MKSKLSKGEQSVVQIMGAFLDVTDAYRRENDALRNILRKLGLSDAAIRGRVNRFLRKTETDENAAQLLKRVCEESLEQLHGIDIEKWLQEVELKGKPQ